MQYFMKIGGWWWPIVSFFQEKDLIIQVNTWIRSPLYLNQYWHQYDVPRILQGAIAYGILALVTPVGAMPDVIIEGEMEFIMENNSTEGIAENLITVIRSPDMEKIVKNEMQFIKENFTFKRGGGW